MRHLPRTPGLINDSAKVCVCVCCWDEMAVRVLFYKMYKHTCPTCMHTKRLLMAQESHFHEQHQVTCSKPAECATSWRGEAICLGGKTEKCLFGLVGLTVSPVKATLQLSAFVQMGTNLHLINPTSPPSSSWRILCRSSSSSLNPLAVLRHVSVVSQAH